MPVASCLQLAALIDGADVRTVEGLAGATSLHVVQQAFINRGGTAMRHLHAGPRDGGVCAVGKEPLRPPTTEIRTSVESVYCRCTGYVRIEPRITKRSRSPEKAQALNQRDPNLRPAAVCWWSAKMFRARTPFSKVTGAAQYVADLHLPGMLHAAVLRSPHPHARIVSIDISAAAAMRGVKAVITGADTAAQKMGLLQARSLSACDRQVRYVGDEVAAVAARDAATARAAVDLSKSNTKYCPPCYRSTRRLLPGAPRVHDDAEGNVAHHFSFERGDVDDGFAASDVVVEGTWESSRHGIRRSKR